MLLSAAELGGSQCDRSMPAVPGKQPCVHVHAGADDPLAGQMRAQLQGLRPERKSTVDVRKNVCCHAVMDAASWSIQC